MGIVRLLGFKFFTITCLKEASGLDVWRSEVPVGEGSLASRLQPTAEEV